MTTLTMTRGSTAQWNVPITLAGLADPLPPEAVITWTATYSVGSDPILEKTSADGILVINAEEGLAQLQLDADDTLVLSEDHDSVLAWDIWLTIGSDRYQLTSGSLTVHVGPRLWEDA